MLTLRELFSVQKDKLLGEVGIEVEQEFLVPVDALDTKTWCTHKDGSLRGHGYEFVTREPINRKKTHGVLTELSNYLSNISKHNDHDSPRTSIHIHINTLDMTPMQVWNQIISYWLLDSCLVELCGIYRVTNLFCLRLRDATGLIQYAQKELDDKRSYLFRGFSSSNMRYSSQNLNALSKFRSLEYRAKSGKFDEEDTKEWINTLLHIKDTAKEFNNPREILEYFYSVGPNAFAKKFLTYHYYTKVVSLDGYAKMMEYNADLLIDLVGLTQWEDVLAKKEKVTAKAYILPMDDLQPLVEREDWINVQRNRVLINDPLEIFEIPINPNPNPPNRDNF